MKKTELVGILLTATILIGGISYYTICNSNLAIPTRNIQTNNQIHLATPTKTTSTSISKTPNTVSSTNEIAAAQNINLSETAQLESSSNLYITQISILENQITQKLQSVIKNTGTTNSMVNGLLESSQIWDNQIHKMLQFIKVNLTTHQLEIFNKQVALSKNFIINEIKETQSVNSGEKIQYLNSATQALYMSGRSTNFLLFNYIINNGINPQLSNQYAFSNQAIFSADNGNLNHYTPQQLDFIKQYKDDFNLTQEKSNNYMTLVKENKMSVSTAYSNINKAWTVTLNNIYQELSNVSKQSETPSEYNKIWLNYKSEMVNLEAQMYSNKTEQNLAKQRLSIRLTQMECYNLLNQFASSVFSHK
ncbi:MAG: hypothetical protein ACRC6T_11140 [Sarcina sp.]